MIIYEVPGGGEQTSHRLIAIFGLGLIGQKIYDVLNRMIVGQCTYFNFSWNDPTKQASQLDCILQYAKLRVAKSEYPSQLSIVWSAGRIGFAANTDETQKELIAFSTFLEFADAASRSNVFSSVKVHFCSSAGGLYEGRRVVDEQTGFNICRPYSELKLAQEKLLKSRQNLTCHSIYRISSVYGYTKKSRRVGLVSALIQGVRNNAEVYIYGRANTLRDYVYSDDIGRFIADDILNDHAEPSTYILASGKATSIAEVVVTVERITQRRIFLRYVARDDNVLDNSYRLNDYGARWTPTDLSTGITRLLTYDMVPT